MNYYGIVEKINFESGIYGRKQGRDILIKNKNTIISSLAANSILTTGLTSLALAGITFSPVVGIVGGLSFLFNNRHSPIINLNKTKESFGHKLIIIPNELLNSNYSIENELVLFNLFNSENQFKKIMKSKGNSNLVILERDNLPPNIKHYGGKEGIFSYGLYCEHPKNTNILLPLKNYNELIKTIILEECLRSFEALGAKDILIEDETELELSGRSQVKSEIGVAGNFKSVKEVVRRKTFGTGFFNPDRAFDEIYFLPDFPNIMTVIKARKQGNLLSEEFSEIININIGLDIDIIGLFKNTADFSYDRKWHFIVNFFDKNELK